MKRICCKELYDACAYAADAIKCLRNYYKTNGFKDTQDLPLIERQLRKALRGKK